MVFVRRLCLHLVICAVAVNISIVSSEDEVQILICRWTQILSLSLPNLTLSTLPMNSISRSQSIDYDPVDNTIYWTDVNTYKLNAKQLPNGTEREVLYSLITDSKEYYGVAVDSQLRKVFYTDKGRDSVCLVDMDGNNDHKLADAGSSSTSPTAITLDQGNRKVYFAVAGDGQSIGVVDYDGTGKQTVIDLGSGSISGLTLDKTEGVLYWCDKQTHKVESVFINGAGRKELFYSKSSDFTDIYLFGKILYFLESDGVVYAMNTDGGTAQPIKRYLGKYLTGLVVFSSTTIPDCQEGQYGVNCSDCGQCLEPKLCEPITGLCLGDCVKGYGGKTCMDECKKGSFGRGCHQLCGDQCEGGNCDRFNGTCLSTCKPGWAGLQCRFACPEKTFGPGCTPCGFCIGAQGCSPMTGDCPGDCEEGWSGPQCRINKCPPMTHGLECKPCGNCLGNDTCDIITGNCDFCERGWKGDSCLTVSDSGASTVNPGSLLIGAVVGVVINMGRRFQTAL